MSESLSFGQRLEAKAEAPDHVSKRRKLAGPTRENKNRPQQLPSNRMPKRFRVSSGLKAGELERNQSRDPRFADAAEEETQTSSDVTWQTKYSFVADMRRAEVKELQEKLATSNAAYKRRGRNGSQRERLREERLSTEEDEEIRLQLARMQNQLRAHDQVQAQKRAKSAVRKKEVSAIKEGKRPYFVKPAVLKEQVLVEQYEQLKSEGKLEKFMSKKRQRVAAKSHTAIPRERRGFGD